MHACDILIKSFSIQNSHYQLKAKKKPAWPKNIWTLEKYTHTSIGKLLTNFSSNFLDTVKAVDKLASTAKQRSFILPFWFTWILLLLRSRYSFEKLNANFYTNYVWSSFIFDIPAKGNSKNVNFSSIKVLVYTLRGNGEINNGFLEIDTIALEDIAIQK